MEVAGQWRREWAGTAEYGKVTEGGVTRQVARAMEVLHASAPGARVRVLRAAYHSTSGPGAPASSYLLHSSRRVLSSGYNFIEAETSPSKPLEISSTPLESSSPEIELEKENYKVTEPDDFEISEPSKWRGSKSINSLRMPSEESSSTDNTSVIDSDYNHTNTVMKSKERLTSQTVHKKPTTFASLLDAPVSLSTLKYKSLLNGSDSWNNRRKSYSFEETPELEDSILRGTNTLTMESSTDSGICKSTEIFNDSYNFDSPRYGEKRNKMDDIHEETFKDWLSKDRPKPYINVIKSNKEHTINVERNDDGNITLQSAGKVLITLPTPTKTDECYETNKRRISDDTDRRTKKVEFCKTELHFAAESGTVNIIATDEKPPPSNDFRKKRSAFVPMTDNYNKSITLFGEKTDNLDENNRKSNIIKEEYTIDENTAATKSILKNKIPKPKPYLLGENMVIGDSNEPKATNEIKIKLLKPSAVSLINRQLQPERRLSPNSRSSTESERDWSSFHHHHTSANMTNKIGLINYPRNNQKSENTLSSSQIEKDASDDCVKDRVKNLQMSPTATHAKTRKLRESDLTYFGVANTREPQSEKRKHSLDSIFDENNLREEILHSVQLVKLISNSVCNSEADSDEAPDYENLPIKYNFTPQPAPRSRSKYDTYMEGKKEQINLKPILEKDDDTLIVEPRRAKLKKQIVTHTSRSLSEPPKANRQKSVVMSTRAISKTTQIKDSSLSKDNAEKCQKNKISEVKVPERRISESPVYINLRMRETKKASVEKHNQGQNNPSNTREKKTENKIESTIVASSYPKVTKGNSISNRDNVKKGTEKKIDLEKQKSNKHSTERKKNSVHRTKILVTPENSPSKSSEASANIHRNSETSSFREKKYKSFSQGHFSSKTDTRKSIKDTHRDEGGNEIKELTLKIDTEALSTQKPLHKLPNNTTNAKPSLKEQAHVHSHTIGDIMTPQSKASKIEKTDKTENKSRRSKYVINYDDKNGTVSSVCKIKPSHGSFKKKRVVNYDSKENFKEHTEKKNPNKSDLLQLAEHQSGNSKMKSKIYARKSCQIL